VSPAQKERIILVLKSMGLRCLMCGDGTNDVGALKVADVGVSIVSQGPAGGGAGGDEDAEERGDANGQDDALLHDDGMDVQDVSQQQIKLGDASIASPFTAKTSSIQAILHVVRQGRCTLVTTVQMFKILASNGLLHSWSMTVLYLRGVKQGETQSTVAGLLVAFIFALLSFTQPLGPISPRRPTSRVFSWPVIMSIAGQALTHLLFLISAVSLAEPPDPAQPLADSNPDEDFKPNQVNTLVYIAGLVCQANIFAVNYRGHPFMLSFRENRNLSGLLLATWGLAFAFAAGLAPGFVCDFFELVPVPHRGVLVQWLLLDTAVAWTWELVIVRAALGG
jgi:cation-transporting ATPase 13A1